MDRGELSPDTQQRLVGRTLTDYLLYFPALAAAGLIGLITVVVLSRFFSPAEFGNYTLALSTLLFMSTMTSLWLRTSVLRLLPQYTASHEIGRFIGTVTIAGAVVVLAVVVTSILAISILGSRLDKQLQQLLWLIIPAIPIVTIFAILQESHRIQGRSLVYSGLILLRILGGFLLGLLFAILFDLGPAGMILGLITVLVIAIIIHAVRYGGHLISSVANLCWSSRILKVMLAFSLPIVGLNLAATVLGISDRYLIQAYLNSQELGIYSANYAIAEGGMKLIATTFLIAAQPTIFRSYVSEGPEVAFQFIGRLFRYYLMIALPALVGLSLLNEQIVTVFTTREYAVGSNIMIFVSLALFMHGYSLIVGTVFDATKQTMIPFVLFLIAGAINVFLNLLLLPRIGYMAAAWSTCVGYGLLLVLHIFAVRRTAPLRVFGRYIWKIGLASAGMGAVILVLRAWLPPSAVSLVAIISLGFIVYLILSVIVGVVLPEERQLLKARLMPFMIRIRKPLMALNKTS